MYEQPLTTERFNTLTRPSPNHTEFTLDDNDLARTCPLDNGRFPKTAQHDLGLLDKLPLELLQPIMAALDLRTVTDLRRVNQRARDVVDSVPEYQVIIRHAPNAVRALLSIRAAQHITSKALYSALCASQCEHCERFGGYLYLLTCTRLCIKCLQRNDSYLPLRRSSAIILCQKLCLTREDLDGVPRMLSTKGTFSPTQKSHANRSWMADPTSIVNAAIARHGEEKAKDLFSATEPIVPKHFDGNYRFAAVVRVPAYDSVLRTAEWGRYCLGCQGSGSGLNDDGWIQFLRADFHHHLRANGPIRRSIRENINRGVFFHKWKHASAMDPDYGDYRYQRVSDTEDFDDCDSVAV